MIHGLAMRRKPNPSGSMTRIEEPPLGCQGRVDRGQEGTGSRTVRIHSFLVSTFLLYTFVVAFFILPLFESIGQKPWYLKSRRLVTQDIVFRIPDLILLLFQLKIQTNKQSKMSLLDLKTLNNEDLKIRLTEKINVKDWTDSYSKCGYPKLIHRNLHRDATCTEKQKL